MYSSVNSRKQQTWIHRAFSRWFGRHPARPRGTVRTRRVRLGLESLEDRNLMSGGALDPAFHFDGKQIATFDLAGAGSTDQAADVAVDALGRIVVVGSVQKSGMGDFDFGVARFNADGSPDVSFNGTGKQTIAFNFGDTNEDRATAVAIDSNGKIVVAGFAKRGSAGDYDFAVVRLNGDGSPDNSFSSDGKATVFFDLGPTGSKDDRATDVAIDGQGRIVIGGRAQVNAMGNYDFAVARLNANGNTDSTFNGNGRQSISFDDIGGANSDDEANALAIDSSNRIVLAGFVQAPATSNYDFALVRVAENGTLDNSFNGTGKQTVAFNLGNTNNDKANGVAIDGAGRIVVVGSVDRSSAGDTDFAVLRLNADGTPDSNFNNSGKRVVFFDLGGSKEDVARSVAIDSNGRIVVGGYAQRSAGGDFDFAALRLNDNSTVDVNFGKDGKQTVAFNLGGNFDDRANGLAIDASGRIALAGFAQAGAGATNLDFAVARMAGYTVPSSATGSVGQFPTGVVSGDFNGDANKDVAVVNYGPTGGNSVSVVYGTGSGTFSPATTTLALPPGTNPFAIAAGKFSNSGNLDIITGNFAGQSITYLAGNGNGTFKAPLTIPAKDAADGLHKIVAVAVGDLNADNKQDVVAASGDGTYTVFLGNGNGTFNALPSKSALTPIFGVAISPLDTAAGSKPALWVAAFAANKVGVLPGNGNGTFAAPIFTNVGGATNEFLAVADFNGGGNFDVVTSNRDSNTVSVLFGTGSGSFGTPSTYAVGVKPLGIAVADVDQNGVLDIAVANVGAAPSAGLSVLPGNPTGGFRAAQSFAAGAAPFAVAIDRFNQLAPGLDLAAPNFVGFPKDTVSLVTLLPGIGPGSAGTMEASTPAGAPTIDDLSATRGAAGSEVVITGMSFFNVMSVAFNGVEAAFTVDSPTQITVIVPSDAPTGAITVTTDSGVATSAGQFKVVAPVAGLASSDGETTDDNSLAAAASADGDPTTVEIDGFFAGVGAPFVA